MLCWSGKFRGFDANWCNENYSVYVGSSNNYSDLLGSSVSYTETISGECNVGRGPTGH